MIQICSTITFLALVPFFRGKFAHADACLKGSKVVSRKFTAGVERDFKITGPVLSNVSAENERECELACHLDFDCGMFNYYPATKVCELLYKGRSAEYRVERQNGSLFRAHDCLSNLCGHSRDFHCHRFCTVLRSCSHAKSLGLNESGNYTINPDASGKAAPFQVFCDTSDKDGVGVTIVSHDSEDRTYVSGCEAPGCYRRDVHYYGISDVTAQLGALTKVSSHCEQYIKYECRYALIFRDGDTWLVSRDGRRLDYWGGAPPGSKKCACGVAGNCFHGKNCNCDANHGSWLQDDGLMSFKDDLPISSLRIGDVGRWYEEVYYTLGKLKCYGQAE